MKSGASYGSLSKVQTQGDSARLRIRAPTSFPGSLILPPGASEERPWLGLGTHLLESGRLQLNC